MSLNLHSWFTRLTDIHIQRSDDVIKQVVSLLTSSTSTLSEMVGAVIHFISVLKMMIRNIRDGVVSKTESVLAVLIDDFSLARQKIAHQLDYLHKPVSKAKHLWVDYTALLGVRTKVQSVQLVVLLHILLQRLNGMKNHQNMVHVTAMINPFKFDRNSN